MKKNIVLIGMPGCGKTTIGETLAEKLNYKFCDIDRYIVEMENTSIDEMFEHGEDYFRDIETKGVKRVSEMDSAVIATGGGVVTRQENIAYLKRNGIVIFIDRDIENIIQDIDTQSRPLLKDGQERLYKLLEERYKLYQDYSDIRVVNDGDIDSVVEKILKSYFI